MSEPLIVACPYCGAPAGKPCQTRHSDLAAKTHQRRLDAAPPVDYSWADPTPAAQEWADRFASAPQADPRAFIEGRTQMDALGHYVAEAEAALANVTTAAMPALESIVDMADASPLTLVKWCQDQRRLLKALEDEVTQYAGRELRIPREGTMPDGRMYRLRKATNRKAWDREGWERDARHAVIAEGVATGLLVIDPETGEELETARHLAQRIAGAVQAVHGSAPPRVTSLKGLGLDPDDYCEALPGAWTIEYTDPTTTEA